MAVKKIIKDSFEQIIESGKSVTTASAKQIKETFSPWEMIRNSFTDGDKSAEQDTAKKMKEMAGKGGNHTPIDFDSLQKNYADQDKKKIDMMKQRLFQMVKRDEEQSFLKGKQAKAEKERQEAYAESDRKRREQEERSRAAASGNAPQGKLRGMAARRKKAPDPQQMETKPSSSKQ